MLLHSLVQHADSREDAVPDYYQRRPVMWQIELSSSGDSEPLITGWRSLSVAAKYRNAGMEGVGLNGSEVAVILRDDRGSQERLPRLV
ncbi:hypothetical protein ABT373_20085 [Streptomyces sp. NPDC000070]|uniref:hypothetical protein n=1 Tax=Streptomyces sp. NPDC000070 TaxID=3154240 RepID=UPI00331BE191